MLRDKNGKTVKLPTAGLLGNRVLAVPHYAVRMAAKTTRHGIVTFWSALRSVDSAVLLKWLCSSTCAFALVSENCHSFGSCGKNKMRKKQANAGRWHGQQQWHHKRNF